MAEVLQIADARAGEDGAERAHTHREARGDGGGLGVAEINGRSTGDQHVRPIDEEAEAQPAETAPRQPARGIMMAVRTLFLMLRPWKSAMYCTVQFTKL